jgi:hypothetical protein
LFSESTARVLVTVSPDGVAGFTRQAAAHGVPLTELGAVVEAERGLSLAGLGTLPTDRLTSAWQDTLPRLFRG